jgi:hypothetical protein
MGLVYGAGGYVAAAIASHFAILLVFSNAHDRSVEAAMTSIFFFGPAGAILAFVAGWVRGGRQRDSGGSGP